MHDILVATVGPFLQVTLMTGNFPDKNGDNCLCIGNNETGYVYIPENQIPAIKNFLEINFPTERRGNGQEPR